MQVIIILNAIEQNGPHSCIDVKPFSRDIVDKACEFIKIILNYFYSNKVVEGDFEAYQKFYDYCNEYKEFHHIRLKDILCKLIRLLKENDDNTFELSNVREDMLNCLFSYQNFFKSYSIEGKSIFEVIEE